MVIVLFLIYRTREVPWSSSCVISRHPEMRWVCTYIYPPWLRLPLSPRRFACRGVPGEPPSSFQSFAEWFRLLRWRIVPVCSGSRPTLTFCRIRLVISFFKYPIISGLSLFVTLVTSCVLPSAISRKFSKVSEIELGIVSGIRFWRRYDLNRKNNWDTLTSK